MLMCQCVDISSSGRLSTNFFIASEYLAQGFESAKPDQASAYSAATGLLAGDQAYRTLEVFPHAGKRKVQF